ncbi:hypothetical protein TKK_0014536 [Trichogramma kaykai]
MSLQTTNPKKTEEDTRQTVSPTGFDAKAVAAIINLVQQASEQAMHSDPIMVRSLNFKRLCDLAVQIYEELYRDILRRSKQSKLTDDFGK